MNFITLGDKYIGAWFKGEMHGEGVKSQMDGSVLEGNFAAYLMRRLQLRYSSYLLVHCGHF